MKSLMSGQSLITVLLLNLVTAVSFLNSATIRDKFSREYQLIPGGELDVSNTNGSIVISSWDRETIRIEAVKK